MSKTGPQIALMEGRRARARKAVVPRRREVTLHIATADVLTNYCRPDWQWSHFSAGEARDGRTGSKLKRMGLKRGWPDFLILAPTNRVNRRGGLLFALELKRYGEELTDDQRLFASWCGDNGVPHAVCTDIDKVLSVLAEWNCLSISLASGRKGGAR